MPKPAAADQKVLDDFESVKAQALELWKAVENNAGIAEKAGLFRNGGINALLAAKGALRSRINSAATLKTAFKRFTYPLAKLGVSPATHKSLQKPVKDCLKEVDKAVVKARKAISIVEGKEKLAGDARKTLTKVVGSFEEHSKVVNNSGDLLGKAIDLGTEPDPKEAASVATSLIGLSKQLKTAEATFKSLKGTKLPGLEEIEARIKTDCEAMESMAGVQKTGAKILAEILRKHVETHGDPELRAEVSKRWKREVKRTEALLGVAKNAADFLKRLADLEKLFPG